MTRPFGIANVGEMPQLAQKNSKTTCWSGTDGGGMYGNAPTMTHGSNPSAKSGMGSGAGNAIPETSPKAHVVASFMGTLIADGSVNN